MGLSMETEGRIKLEIEIVIEVPRGSFLKRTSSGDVDFFSPFPCPFNYGSVRGLSGPDGDPLDAVLLGPRVPRGTRATVRVVGAVQLVDRGLIDDKLICSARPLGRCDRYLVLLFFKFYAGCKRLLYMIRRLPGSTYCAGWSDPGAAIERARPSL